MSLLMAMKSIRGPGDVYFQNLRSGFEPKRRLSRFGQRQRWLSCADVVTPHGYDSAIATVRSNAD